MSLSTVESPLALYSSKTGVGISSYSFMICFLGKEYRRGLELSQRSFSLLDYHIQLIFMMFQTCCIWFKSRKSPGHSNTDVTLIKENVKNVFCGFRINTKNIAVHSIDMNMYINFFRILYWHVNFYNLNPIEEVCNVKKRRCESLPNINSAHYGILCRTNK